MVNFEITKINKLLEVNNDKAHNFYYIYYGRIYNKNRTKYKKFKYVEWFDIFDVQEYFDDKVFITDKDIKEYANSFENSYLYSIKNFNDKEGLQKFYNYCNETIKNYNEIVGANYYGF